ncbi:MAG TPA: BrnT family toxin [Vicinamibacterales bacterium]|nr:BrnT family toxin [Vicinamibacterales bacterium]
MRFEWDPEKSEANLKERGFDFAFASLIFEGPTLQKQDRRHDYGELRVVAIGLADGFALTIVYTDRLDDRVETIRRIISARRSNRRERQAYQAAIEQAE